jgi:hypothetical protein
VIYIGGFVVGSETRDHAAQKHQPWTETHQTWMEMQQMWTQADIEDDQLFYTKPMQQQMVVYPDKEG